MEADLKILQDDWVNFYNNPLLGYLNINNFQNKVTCLRIVFKDLLLDCLLLSGTTLDQSFPTAQFALEGYEIRSRKDIDKHGGGLIKFVRSLIKIIFLMI